MTMPEHRDAPWYPSDEAGHPALSEPRTASHQAWELSDDTTPLTGLAGMFGPPIQHPPRATSLPRHRGRRRRPQWADQPVRVRWVRWSSLLLAATAATLVAMLSVLGGLISYGPLRQVASPGSSTALTACWPMLIYGPWLVASLSILRAALHQRHARHSWAVVVLFSGLAVALCVAHAPPHVTDVAVAGLPPISALVAFQQIVRQITLISPPRHALPRQRMPGTAGQAEAV
ncbi:DUF2637 domain-containing protein [Streptomyces hainanensis]|uniref:DUF2637 domain-containing protein n=1 Tax=Streptomyces hainanensis TaxID=402648 RepID=A0A4R4SQK3_9ACTN|nr:DUF2637 domain-containing protein [Streptomyces hainanensis]TDC64934.1 DUF2637 domain-containing protein [Streptomyces hainanensis]